MRVSCPCCGAVHELDALIADAEARWALARLGRLGDELVALVVQYASCHRPRRRALTWSRFRRLLNEVAEHVEAGEIRRKGRSWTVTRAEWIAALRVVVERRNAGRLETPLRGHGYLLEVARAIADRTEAAGERDIEQARREGRGPERRGVASQADGYEALLAEARRRGVDVDERGMVRAMPELAAAIRASQQSEGGS